MGVFWLMRVEPAAKRAMAKLIACIKRFCAANDGRFKLTVRRLKNKTLEVVERLDELGLEYLYTPAYSPDFNPIEFVFSQFKAQLKKVRLEAILKGRDINLWAETERIWNGLEREKIKNCVEHAARLLK